MSDHQRIEMSGPWITEHEEEIVLDALRNGWYGETAYHYCEKFEAEFAAYHDREFALMTPNCTSAIHLILMGLGIGPGDEVIAPECTWIASVAPVSYCGAEPVFCDIDANHWCLTAEAIEAKITDRTKAIIAVDQYGNMPDWDDLTALSKKYAIPIIEDSAEALGSVYKNIKAGKFGIGSVFSFHRTKTITTGEGGMLLTDDEELFERCKLLRDHGRSPGTWYNQIVGYKYMPFNLQASLGLAQFNRLEELLSKKRSILQQYRENLSDIPGLLLNTEPENGVNGAWCTTAVFPANTGITKDAALSAMIASDIQARPFFYPLSILPAYPGREEAGRRDNPVAYDVSSRGVCLPSAYSVTTDQIQVVTDMINGLALGKVD